MAALEGVVDEGGVFGRRGQPRRIAVSCDTAAHCSSVISRGHGEGGLAGQWEASAIC